MLDDDDVVVDDDLPPNEPETDNEDDVTPTPDPDNPEDGEEPDKPESDDGDPDKSDEDEPEKPPETQGKSKRALRRAIAREKQRNAELERRLAALEERTPETRTPELKEPKREDFDSVEEYYDARADYRLEVKLQEKEQKDREQTQRSQTQQESAQLAQSWDEKLEDARDKHDDYDDVLESSDVPVSPLMGRYFMESDIGAELAYHIAQRPEYKKIANLPPLRQAAELGKIEDKVKAQLDKPKPKKPSSATAPPDPVKPKGTGKSEPTSKDDVETWMNKRQKQVHGK